MNHRRKMDGRNGIFGKRVSAIIDGWASGNAEINMVVNFDSRNKNILAIRDSAVY